ncbi:L,D-transpeptidase family protein [Paraurantiacibacter namhicola]|uniref:Putative L,D-transpeptidase YkuD n=1 Tax=Paraurantiacibacter namhicola TaxID=645517 RepID=A0A1C7D8T7_9SPHN|nr:L,D-transpeptidase family protein [Paraurantiacibacter namhicola]ANU07855.1 Putative L,D-transpeptidase YkuD [Paraurantiacibacter namhicola]
MRHILATTALFALAACGLNGADNAEDDASASASDANASDASSSDNAADSMASRDPAPGEQVQDDMPDSEERPMMQLQVVLDREGFGPGVIDGKMGMSTENALSGFQEANGLEVTGKHDAATKEKLSKWDNISATRVVTIPAEWGEIDFADIPEDTAAKAKMDNLGYKSLDEKLAERFHTTVEVLRQLNPGGKPAGMASDAGSPESGTEASPSPSASASKGSGDGYFQPGQQIRVPNVGADRIDPNAVTDKGWQQTLAALGVGTEQPEVDRIVVSKSEDTLKAYSGDKLVAMFTVSSGSSEFPLPLGEWDIVGEAYNPPYSYDPEVLGQGEGKTYTLPPGPNGPVGVIWIDLSKEHYGIHGTPDPETIGRAQSSGCVRLTNWDAARLAGMVNTSTKVIFEA